MSGKNPTKRKKTAGPYHHGDLRRALIIAGMAELAEKGVEGFTLRGCARRAGVSHAAPAHHFPDARVLLTALAAEGHIIFAGMMRKRITKAGDDPAAQFAASGLGYVDFALKHPALFRLMFASDSPDTDDQVLVRAGDASFSVLLDAVRDLRGADPRTRPEMMAEATAAWSLVHGLAHLLLAGRLPPLLNMRKSDRDKAVLAIIAKLGPRAKIAPHRNTGRRQNPAPRASAR